MTRSLTITKTYLEREELIAWTRSCVERLMERFAVKARAPKTRWAEKTPAHVLHIELIHEVFPKAQFVHMIRNGYDVVKSLQNMTFAPRDVRCNTRTWINCVKAGRAAGERLPGIYTEVRYEQLVKDPKAVITGLCEFLEEPFNETLLEFHKPEQNSWKTTLVPLKDGPINTYREMSLWSRIVFDWFARPLMLELDST